MFECHNHLALDARLPGHLDMMNQSECEHTLLALNGLKDDLMSGVTTARCLGDRNYIDVVLREQSDRTGPPGMWNRNEGPSRSWICRYAAFRSGRVQKNRP